MQQAVARILLLVATLASSSIHARAAGNQSAPELVAQIRPAVVSISSIRTPAPSAGTTVAGTSTANGAAELSGGTRSPRGTHVRGSGFIIDPSGVIVTNRHVIEGTTQILV